MIQKNQFDYIDKQISLSLAQKVAALNLNGVALIPSAIRVDTSSTLLQSIVGMTDVNGNGISGIEKMYNSTLAGSFGLEELFTSPVGVMPGGMHVVKQVKNGNGLVLSLDQSLQLRIRELLTKQVIATNSLSGTAAVMDVKTGEILAMESVVSMNNLPSTIPSSAVLGQGNGVYVLPTSDPMALTFVYEPGSVMKVTTFSGALERGIITPTTQINIPPYLTLFGYRFADAEAHGNEVLTASQVLQQSSNIGTIEIAEKLGAQTVYNMQSLFGFGHMTPLTFPGESPGILKPLSQWSGTAIGSTPIGQNTGVTVMQLLDAYNAIANGGVYVNPKLVDGFVNSDGTVVKTPPSPTKRLIPAWVDKDLVTMMKGVVSNAGTAPAAAIPGYSVAGKTGTAQVPGNGTGGYLPGKFDATFVGFAPANNPQLTCVVMFQEPTGYYGGSEAGPIFSEIMQYALHLYHIAP
jgi:cell division protein FtsI/penicillin-binding protein 2